MTPPSRGKAQGAGMKNRFDSAARPTIHDLQAMAVEAARPRRGRRGRGASRAALLHLIDTLSRWGGTGLALIAGLTIFCAVAAGGAYPLRAAAWAGMVMAALYISRRLRAEFRAGEASAARPFHWRANYTASLSVAGAAFGAGALLLLPAGAPEGLALQTLALILAGALGAALLHAPHGRSAAAIFLPAALFAIFGAWRTGGASLAIFGAAASLVAGSATLFLVSWRLRAQAIRRFPRTALIRREAGPRKARAADDGELGAAAAM